MLLVLIQNCEPSVLGEWLATAHGEYFKKCIRFESPEFVKLWRHLYDHVPSRWQTFAFLASCFSGHEETCEHALSTFSIASFAASAPFKVEVVSDNARRAVGENAIVCVVTGKAHVYRTARSTTSEMIGSGAITELDRHQEIKASALSLLLIVTGTGWRQAGLHVAAAAGQLNTVRLLLCHDYDPTECDKSGISVVFCASMSKDANVVTKLCESQPVQEMLKTRGTEELREVLLNPAMEGLVSQQQPTFIRSLLCNHVPDNVLAQLPMHNLARVGDIPMLRRMINAALSHLSNGISSINLLDKQQRNVLAVCRDSGHLSPVCKPRPVEAARLPRRLCTCEYRTRESARSRAGSKGAT